MVSKMNAGLKMNGGAKEMAVRDVKEIERIGARVKKQDGTLTVVSVIGGASMGVVLGGGIGALIGGVVGPVIVKAAELVEHGMHKNG